ncbi:hypothetical protein diail_9012 [Diaporthe ilicicola]|nr:hypothetical protein diail_9012 [Diaporthe ilicicola]
MVMGDTAPLPFRKVELEPPPLEQLVQVIKNGIKSNFLEVTVECKTAPDLQAEPFHLAGTGLCGNPRVIDIGGPANFRPVPNFDAKYDALQLAKNVGMSPQRGVLLGAGAGPFQNLGFNSELILNLAYGSDGSQVIRNRSRNAKITDTGDVLCEDLGNITGFGIMGHIFGCDGEAGPCLYIKARGRVGSDGFTQSIQRAIKAAYGNKLISVGGVFVMHHGRAKLHVMPDFSKTPFCSEGDVHKWLRFFEVDAPLICFTVFHSSDDNDLGLKDEHTHCMALDGTCTSSRAGHFHYDLEETKQIVEYEGWFNVAETLYRIDAPSSCS